MDKYSAVRIELQNGTTAEFKGEFQVKQDDGIAVYKEIAMQKTAISSNPYINAGSVDISAKGDESKLRSPNGNVFYGIPHDDIIKRLLFDTDDEYCGFVLPNGETIKRVTQAPKDQMKMYLESARYETIRKCKYLYISCLISRGAKSVEGVSPIVSMIRQDVEREAEMVETGEIKSELKHDAEYSMQWLNDYLLKGEKRQLEYEYEQHLKEEGEDPKSSQRVFAFSDIDSRVIGGSRYHNCSFGHIPRRAFGVSLIFIWFRQLFFPN